jgi:chitin synthase
MFQNTDKRGLMEKEALPAEIQDGETTEVLKGSSARRHGLLLVGYSLGGSRLRA